MDFREDEKKKKKGKLFEGCLVGRRIEENEGVFSSGPPKNFLPPK